MFFKVFLNSKFKLIYKIDLSPKCLVRSEVNTTSPYLSAHLFWKVSLAAAYDLAGGCGGGEGGTLKGRGLVHVWGACRERERGSIYITSSLISCHQFLSSEEPDTNN